MPRFPIASGLSLQLATFFLACALSPGVLASPPDTLAEENTPAKAYAFGPAQALTDSSVLGRWEIDSRDRGGQEDPLNRGRMVFHFYADHKVDMHFWSMSTDSSSQSTAYNGGRVSGTWIVRDTLLGIIDRECEGFNDVGERECGFMESHKDFGHDTDWSVVKPRDGERYIVDADMSGMLAWRYRGADRDTASPPFWTAAPVRPRAYGSSRKPDSDPPAPFYDLLGRRPAAPAAIMPRFAPGSGKPAPAVR